MDITSLKHPDYQALLENIAEVAAQIHAYGWAEANAGNLSIDVNNIVSKHIPTKDKWFIVSRTGSRYRQTAIRPCDNLLLVNCSAEQDIFFPEAAKPTSEWISHRSLQMANARFSVILHTHPAEIIALSSLPIMQQPQEFNQMMRSILPELPLYLPEGIAICPHRPPGSLQLCQSSEKALTDQKALIWMGHGLLTFAEELDEALDYMEIIVKAARIFFLKSNMQG
ncbi:MAG: class II aldolase/adducin family protein [Candidatus Cloacimonetes bacterium]|jgi:rhamnulose-1-phosphate aldolase|nr:class II aldolase/adducin family protein [Candidatus Cloacimonadota bacterium]MCB5286484.1 class II aldolase/adducin family protein [Candidatus Cloacimonadota bacterium]MCK9183766.1 class II aldolase/adducin family protein [Candidatus Cloacimonadota bacterium]MCK9583474.1 class II aldolase/adducin family protein [Candidatus Cloacimonadota bacterium]MDY0228806.1 class II aldolase/adducin family protein [Candidatus Cloacimonadaceae bacterium]